MPRLSLDINGSKELNAGPWCFNYSLFRGCASKKLKKHNFPVQIMFCRLLQCFYLKLWDLYLKKKLSSSLCLFIHSPAKCFPGSEPRAGCRAACPAPARDKLKQVDYKYPQEQRLHGISEEPPPASDNPHAESFFPHLSAMSCISVLAPIFFSPSSVHLISTHSHKEFIHNYKVFSSPG